MSVSSSGVEGGVTEVILDIRPAAMAEQDPAALVVPCLKIVSEVQCRAVVCSTWQQRCRGVKPPRFFRYRFPPSRHSSSRLWL